MARALSLSRIRKSYRAGLHDCFAEAHVLRGATLHVAEGEVVCVTGARGAGKSTLLLVAGGLMRPDAGTVAWFGSSEPPTTGSRTVAYIAEPPAYDWVLTVRETLEHYAASYGLSGGHGAGKIDEVLERLSLRSRAHECVAHLSRARARRLELARALLSGARLLLLDEPLAGLDSWWRRRAREVLRGLAARGTTMVFGTSDASTIGPLVTRVVALRDGVCAVPMSRPAAPSRHRVLARSLPPGLSPAVAVWAGMSASPVGPPRDV